MVHFGCAWLVLYYHTGFPERVAPPIHEVLAYTEAINISRLRFYFARTTQEQHTLSQDRINCTLKEVLVHVFNRCSTELVVLGIARNIGSLIAPGAV